MTVSLNTSPPTVPAIQPTRVLIDCDPGIDDAFALLLALHHPALEVVGVTTVAGNRPLEIVTQNARDLLHFYGRSDVPLAVGEEFPIHREQVTASVHGTDGIGDHEIPASPVPAVEEHGVDFLIRSIRDEAARTESDGLTVIAVGPLTNLARALERDPEIASLVREVVIMGGGENAGNITPAAEFNFFADPEAAAAVLAGGWPIRLCGLPLTLQSAAHRSSMREIAEMPGSVAAALSDWLNFYSKGQTEVGDDGPPLHDAVAVAAVIDPTLVGCEPVYSTVQTEKTSAYGENVVDRSGSPALTANVQLGVSLDHERFWELLLSVVRNVSRGE